MATQRQVLFWLAMAVVLVLAVLSLRAILLPFVAGMVIAYALNPLAEWLARAGIGRLGASILVVALLVVTLVVVGVFLLPLLFEQLRQLAVSLPGEIERMRSLMEAWARSQLGDRVGDVERAIDQGLAQLADNWGAILGVVAGSLWAQGRALVDVLAVLLVTPLVVFYLLVDWPQMIARIDSWLPREHAPTLRRLAGDIDSSIAAFIRGQGLVCTILAIYYAATLSAAGLRYGLLIGVATGVMSFVPFVGWALGFTLSAIVAVVQGWPDVTLVLVVAAIFLGAQLIDAGFLSPKIVGPKIGLHPVALIFALLVFSNLFGTVGVLVAVPLAAVVGVLARFALEVYLGSGFYRGGALPGAAAAQPEDT